MSVFFELFSPGYQHRLDEQERLEHTREVEGIGVPGKGPIDLTSGVVLIKAVLPTPIPVPEPEDAQPEDALDGDEPEDA